MVDPAWETSFRPTASLVLSDPNASVLDVLNERTTIETPIAQTFPTPDKEQSGTPSSYTNFLSVVAGGIRDRANFAGQGLVDRCSGIARIALDFGDTIGPAGWPTPHQRHDPVLLVGIRPRTVASQSFRRTGVS